MGSRQDEDHSGISNGAVSRRREGQGAWGEVWAFSCDTHGSVVNYDTPGCEQTNF